ncbi:MAG: metallophosphoesterase [Verrucomicrobiota bacterium JB025]|nr:metallophosphoesterase [Verrucomicrobiota bacterium JB025]
MKAMRDGRLDVRPGLTRRAALRVLLAGGCATLADAAWLEPGHLSVTRKEIVLAGLPAGMDGLKVALLADFHYRPDDDDGLLGKVVRQVRAEAVDLVMLAGDFVNDDPVVLAPLLEHLGELEARHGVFAVAGNHDGWSGGAAEMRRGFEKRGISFLVNQHCRVGIRGESLAVAGTDYVWLGNPDPKRAVAGIPRDVPVVAMVHEPDYFDVMEPQRPGVLQLSGHTHGGQCRVPVAGYAPVKVEWGRKYVHGLFERGDSRLFVTRGVGTTGMRVRFACPPELAVLTLRPGGK